MTTSSSAPSSVRMATLAKLSGVPAATIKHYLREGLLPEPAEKPHRNVALYDPALADRIRQIKQLQREHFLPLRLIKSVLDGEPTPEDDAAAAAAVERAVSAMERSERRSRSELIAAGARADDLAFFERLGILRAADDDTFGGDDVALLRVLAASRRAGITKEMLPPETLGPYISAIRELVAIELEMFRKGVVPRAGADLGRVTEAATQLSEQLVVLLRRKMLVPMLETLVADKQKSKKRKKSS